MLRPFAALAFVVVTSSGSPAAIVERQVEAA
jgi:hypothetical protein